MVFLSSLSAISIDNRGGMGGMSGSVWWGGRWQNLCLGHFMSSHDTYTVANDTPVGHIVSGSKPRSLLPNWHPPWVPLFQP